MGLQERIFLQLHGATRTGLTATQRIGAVVIVLPVVLAVIGTEPSLPPAVSDGIETIELLLGVVFLAEYLARIWSSGCRPEFAGLRGRIRYATGFFALVDLLALLPFLLGAIGSESLVLRVVRVFRLLALSRLARYSEAMRLVITAIADRRYELLFAVMLAGAMILISSAALYVVEGGTQPEVFGSILRAMWWSVSTLTTVGYGDAVPQTPLGKVFAGLTAIAGIGMIAMPTGILAASFSDGLQGHESGPQPKTCRALRSAQQVGSCLEPATTQAVRLPEAAGGKGAHRGKHVYLARLLRA
ncbi:MAG: ion transporter [Betaproteobacteria bacterium]|nr:ion transporter [Betaproteobacteria bacterium]